MTTQVAHKPGSWAEYLDLPAGWIATEFVATIELEFEPPYARTIRTGIPKPYTKISREQWQQMAREAIALASTPTPATR